MVGPSLEWEAMKILISNDDGIHAPGIQALYEAVHELGEIYVVAPGGEQSAVGHAITISDPLKVSPVTKPSGLQGYAVGGTPADSVKLAVCALMEEKPDLVLSGINLGPNAGISILYSGTVSAATEGTILGIPSMALSLNTFTDPIWETGKAVACKLTQELMEKGLPEGVLLNVNIPNIPFDQIQGYRVTRMGASHYVETFQKRSDPRGNAYFWMDGYLEQLGETEGTDIQALADGYVSLTPIEFDLTRHSALPILEGWGLKDNG